MTAKTCPHCGAPEVDSDRWSRKFSCGYTVNFDGPPFPCRNAKPAEPAPTTDLADPSAQREYEARAARLTEAGDDCSAEEAATLTDDQYAHRLTVAQQAQREREELARIKSEEKVENDRLLRNTVRG